MRRKGGPCIKHHAILMKREHLRKGKVYLFSVMDVVLVIE